MKMEMKIKNRSYRYDINKPRYRHKYSKQKKCLIKMLLICIKQHPSNIEAQFMKKLSDTETELKKALLIKKACRTTVKSVPLKSEIFRIKQ